VKRGRPLQRVKGSRPQLGPPPESDREALNLIPMRVLVVEDETDMADAVARGLRREGYAVDVVKDIAERHGGRVGLASTPGTGSTFVIWLPAVSRPFREPTVGSTPMEAQIS
jgi:hypothetical protein